MHHCSAALVPPPPPTETVLQLLYYPAAVWPSILCLFCIYLYFVNRMSVFVFWKSPTIETAALLSCCLTFKHACDQLTHNVTHIQFWGWGSWAGFWTLRCLHSTLNTYEEENSNLKLCWPSSMLAARDHLTQIHLCRRPTFINTVKYKSIHELWQISIHQLKPKLLHAHKYI